MCNTFGAEARANVPKGTFSTDCKSDCLRIGLTCRCERLCRICTHSTDPTPETRDTVDDAEYSGSIWQYESYNTSYKVGIASTLKGLVYMKICVESSSLDHKICLDRSWKRDHR